MPKQQPVAPAHDDDELEIGQTVGPSDLDDDDDGFVATRRGDGDDLWDSSDDVDSDTPVAEDTVDECPDCGGDKNAGDCTCSDEIGRGSFVDDETLNTKPIGELLSPIALQGVSTKQKKKTLAQQSNDWLNQTLARLSGLLEANPEALEAPDWRDDVELLKAAATARDLILDSIEPEPVATESRTTDFTEAMRHRRSGTDATGVIVQVPMTNIQPDPAQARDEGADDELADSIKANGVLQPIELRTNAKAVNSSLEAQYIIVDGERRFRGARKAGLDFIKATITDEAANEGDRLIRQVVRNDGKRLKPMEEARTFKRIMADKGWNIQQLATAMGKSKSTVSDRVALADVPTPFLESFEKGHLTAAAAPILRGLADVPEKVLNSMAIYASEGPDWERAVNDGKPVPLKVVEAELLSAAQEDDELEEMHPGGQAEKGYRGPVATIGKHRFAVDVKQYRKLVEIDEAEDKRRAAEKIAPGETAAKPAPKPEKSKPSAYQIAERKRAAEARKKAALRRAYFQAVSPKLPAALDAKWSRFVIDHLLTEMRNDSRRAAYQALVKPGPVAASVNITKALANFADDQDLSGRVRMIVQLLLASDLVIGSYNVGGAKRITEAAALAKVDLKKVKLEEPASPSRPTNKAKVRTLNAAFLKPYPLTVHLEAVVGKGPMTRTDLTKKIWGYIKRNGLLNMKERRLIDADVKLRVVFGGKKQVSMFEMTKLLNKHLVGYKG